ncbi:uncharacterized protein LOC123511588 isoform X2 [Portunus trituberculatus]|nr:uncharacterized protein LOC123511588 isoform X2 [Portunus trituberculatus]
MREENTGVLRLINILKKSSMSSPGGRCHRATHRRSAATDKNTSTSVFPKTTAATTVDAKKGKKCLERPVLGSHDKDFPSRPTAGWRAACELHRRSSRLKERQHVAHIHYEDLSLEEEEKEDISASSGSDQEYQPHHPRDSHSLTRKTKAQRRNQTSMPLMKGHCGWSSEEWKREGDKEGTRVKGAATRKGSNGERSPYTSHTHQGEEETYITTQAHGGRSAHIQLKERKVTQGWIKEKKQKHAHKHDKIKEERQWCTHNLRKQSRYKHSHTKHTNSSEQDQGIRKRKTTRATSFTSRKGRTYERIWSPWKVWSLPNMLSLLLTLLYLGVLITRQGILLMDILRWCRSGHIPFLSAHFTVNRVLRSYVPSCPIFFKVPRVPSSTTIRKATYQTALLLSLQAVPFPPAGSVISQLVAVLRLPYETSTLAEEVIALRRLPQHKQETAWEGLAKKEVPAVECQAAAALLVALKMCCGLNDSSEHHLSFVAARVNGVMMGDALQHPPVRPLFSFDEWMRYLVEVAWLSRQVNPLCEAIAPPPVLAKPLETKLMADLAHLLTFCSTDPAASIPDLENYPNMRRQLEGLGLPLEKLWQAHIIALSAPHDPLLGTLERYVERYTSSSSSSTTRHRHQQESSTRLLRRAQELLQTTFSSTQLFWTQHLHQIQQQLKEHGSSLCLKPVKYPHSLCPLPLKPDGKRRHYTKATANTRHRERKHTHSVATGSSQGMRGVLDERHTVNTSDLVNNSSSCVGVQVKSTPAASLCRALQYRQDSLATSGRKRCHTSSQKSYIRNGKVCQCKNMKRLDKKDQYWRDWNCVHTQSMYSWGKQKYNLMDRKDSCMEEQCGKNHIPNCTTKYGKRNSMKERKKSSQGKQHREGCCHKNTEDFPPQNRNINKPKNSHERHCTLISAEICSHKEEERINYDKGAHIIKRNSRNFKFLHGGYFPVYKNQAKENSEGFSVPAGKNKNKTTAKGENKGSGVSCASEYTRGQRSHITKDLMRKGMNRSTNKSTNFLYMPIEKDTSSKSRYPPGEEDGSQRRNTGIPYTIPHSPEDKVYPWRKKEAHPSTSLSSDDEDAITSSTSSHTSSNSSILAHESLDQLLKDGTSATVLSHTLFVPVPAYRMWQGLDITKDKWKQVWSGLPRSYRCVVEVLVALCGMTCRELLEEVQAMEKMVEIYSSLLFLFPNAL